MTHKVEIMVDSVVTGYTNVTQVVMQTTDHGYVLVLKHESGYARTVVLPANARFDTTAEVFY